MGCGETLFRTGDGHIMCSNFECERSLAVSELLTDVETEHIVTFDDSGWFTMRHPLRERLDDALLRCRVHTYVATPGVGPEPTSEATREIRERGEVTYRLTFREDEHGAGVSATWTILDAQ